jgi:predicted nucleic acid-binding protein
VSKVLVPDSSSLIFVDRRGKLDLLKNTINKDFEVCIPPAIARELIEDSQKLAEKIHPLYPNIAKNLLESSSRFKKAVEAWIEIKPIDYIRYSKAMDKARIRLSKFDKKWEHSVKKGDAELIALCVQLIDNGDEVVALLEDENLKRVLNEITENVKTLSIKEFLPEV